MYVCINPRHMGWAGYPTVPKYPAGYPVIWQEKAGYPARKPQFNPIIIMAMQFGFLNSVTI